MRNKKIFFDDISFKFQLCKNQLNEIIKKIDSVLMNFTIYILNKFNYINY